MRVKKASFNTISTLIYEVLTVVSGLILPRLILSRFGSDYNGIVASINQFTGYAALFVAGVGPVTMAALYKPLANRDYNSVSGIIRATQAFYRKVAIFFVGGLIIFAMLYPLLISSDFDWIFIFSLVLILGLRTFTLYFFGMPYQLLLQADQRTYITALMRAGVIVLNTTIITVFILIGIEFRLVMLSSSLVLAINPIFFYIYARKYYKINNKIEPDNDAIGQRWNAFIHQIANFLIGNTAIVIITLFKGIMVASVYAVYHLVISAIKIVIWSLLDTSIVGTLGNMYAKDEQDKLRESMNFCVFISHIIIGLLVSSTILLIVPFVSVYTAGVHDIDYYHPVFAYISCTLLVFLAFRKPYDVLIGVAGHFKQTRIGAIIEACIHITLTVLLIQWYGIIGVAIGALCAMIYRTIYSMMYVSKHILRFSLKSLFFKCFISVTNMIIIIFIAQYLPAISEVNPLSWIIYALPILAIAIINTTLFSIAFFRNELHILTNILQHLKDSVKKS